VRKGMVIDLKRCIGCFACQIACKAEHGTRPGALWARVVKREYGTFPNVRRVSLPLLCMHCRKGPASRSARRAPQASGPTASSPSTPTSAWAVVTA
jgi:molybdopterin-containing oxidoreductase family iron-sulfur binding subunit